ncbi:Hypothetical protein NTJ_10081 [Nesidiocoris tenuis]|uniref:Chitin-binding type-2 domain-containing protein n=1 Tax=Nesidiocoris tenuis TaxID=355587 RepID=A0ABN7B3E5_9HEMI|nr:Hypothetical protein NTJ_10081 [Nesidiocoris tenuis]
MPRALLRGEQCPSRAPPQHGLVRYLPTAYLDGSAGKPFMINDEGKVKWTPKYPKQCQNPHPNMTCYCVPQVFNPELCECPEADAVAGKAKNSTVGQGDKDYCTSGKDVYHCPMDPNHSHWSPHIGSCQAPKPCKAQCFDHSDQRDWVNVVPNYKMYLQAEDTTF